MSNKGTLAKLIIDISAIQYNFNQIKKILGDETRIVPVIKANAYGAGSGKVAHALIKQGVTMFAVADSQEGKNLRDAGIDKDILLLYQPGISEIESILALDLIPAVSDHSFLEKLNSSAKLKNKIVRIHVEIDTGTGRLGVKPDMAVAFLKDVMKQSNIEVEGIFMHYASSDSLDPEEVEFSKNQTDIFNRVVDELEKNNISIKYKHASCGGALLNYPEARFNMVRPGYILYGYYPNDCFKKYIELRPSFTFASEIIFIKEVSEGTPISYSHTFVTKRKSKIATIALGYSDGLRRALSNKGYVVVKNQKVPIVGRVCMDITMIDVTDIEAVKVGDEVALWDNQVITVDDVAKQCDTIGYEIISTVSEQVQRVYI